jgi:hypothetical protein
MKTDSGIRSIAIKVSAGELESKRAQVLQVLGGKEVYAEPGLAVLEMPDGVCLELYGPGSSYPDFLFEDSEIVVNYRVGNMGQALESASRTGLEIVSGLQRLGSCSAYCYVRDKKGTIFGLSN